MKFIHIVCLAIALVSLTACRGQATGELQPPRIHYGEDICEFCGMIISDERYAAGYITQDGHQRIFDDVGGMFQAHLQMQEPVMAFFVHDYEDTAWIRAEQAHYVLSEGLTTPMLNGLVASETAEKAQALAHETGGTVLTFNEVLAHYEQIVSIEMVVDGEHSHPH